LVTYIAQCSWVTSKVAGGMVLSHMLQQWVAKITRLSVEKTWSSVTCSRYISINQISVGQYLRILDVLVLFFGQLWKNAGKQWPVLRGDFMSRSDETVLKAKQLLASILNKRIQNLYLFSHICNALELLVRLLEELSLLTWSGLETSTHLWVEKT